MIREKLLEQVCYSNYMYGCTASDSDCNCKDCKDAINPLLDKYDKRIRKETIDEFVEKAKEMKFVDANCQELWIERIEALAKKLKEKK